MAAQDVVRRKSIEPAEAKILRRRENRRNRRAAETLAIPKIAGQTDPTVATPQAGVPKLARATAIADAKGNPNPAGFLAFSPHTAQPNRGGVRPSGQTETRHRETERT